MDITRPVPIKKHKPCLQTKTALHVHQLSADTKSSFLVAPMEKPRKSCACRPHCCRASASCLLSAGWLTLTRADSIHDSHSIVNPLEKLDCIARHCAALDDGYASCKVVYTVSFTVNQIAIASGVHRDPATIQKSLRCKGFYSRYRTPINFITSATTSFCAEASPLVRARTLGPQPAAMA
jgi:hypothetical protein